MDGDRGKNYPSGNDFHNHGHTLFLSAANITKTGFSFESSQYISEEKSGILGNGKLQLDDVVITSRGSLGHIAWYNEEIHQQVPFARINSGMLLLRSKEKSTPRFIEQLLKSPIGKKRIDLISFGSAQPQLTKRDIMSYEASFPSLAEQTTIGNFFCTLDNAITIHKRKLDGLRELKKAYLQAMFPQAGEAMPRVRFAGFTEPWVQVALEHIAERVTRKNTKLESTLPLTISAQHGLIDQTEFFNKQVASRDVSGYFLVKKGEFAYNKSYSNGYPWGAVKRLNKYEMGVLSTLYIVFKPIDVDSEFLVQYYETDNWHTEIIKYAAEGARNHGLLNITPTDFFKTVLAIPSTREEQKAISSFLETLDKQITAQHEKVEQLGRLKSAYLQKMFL